MADKSDLFLVCASLHTHIQHIIADKLLATGYSKTMTCYAPSG